MAQVNFLIKGSAAEPYEVTFIKKGAEVSAFCTCPAGEWGNFCKHRIAILEGDKKQVVSSNVADMATVINWLAGSQLESALAEMREAERVSERAKRELAKAKKALAAVMHL